MTKETIGFLKGLRARYGGNFPRCTEIDSFDRTEKREVAKRDLQLRFDKKNRLRGAQGKRDRPRRHFAL